MDLVHLATTILAPPVLLGVSLCAFVVAYLRSRAAWSIRSRGLPLPPGPTPLPIVGNMLDWPQSNQWAAFRDMGAKYGDMLHFNVLGRRMVVLGNPSDILELLDKRSGSTSSRDFSATTSLFAQEFNFSGMPYGPWWRRHKRTFWQEFHPGAVSAYLPAQRRGAHKFLKKLLTTPSKLREHVRFTFSSAILKVLFDVDIADDGDELLEIVEAMLEWHGEAFVPGKYLVEVFSFLQHIPPWVPGAEVQRLSLYWRSTVARLRVEIDRLSKVDNGGSSAVHRMVMRMAGNSGKPLAEEAEEIIKNVAAVAIEGGSDTMFSTVQSVFLALSLYPDVQRRAQAELDAVVGSKRLPDFEDSDMLVYINALVREGLRWQNVLPFAIPHLSIKDDEFRGYFIPAGTNIFPNVWACMHDPDVYEDPHVFRPERFIREGKLDFSAAPDPARFIFGFGRRMCPGRYFAVNGLFINIALVLHVFDITPPVDDNGREIKIEPQVTDGFLSYPVDCRCTIKPRSAQAEALIWEAQAFH